MSYGANTNTVVVVDDDPSMLKGIGRLLEAFGYRARVFSSAETFLDEDWSDAACLVLDVNLGGMSGIDLQRRLTAAGSEVPVIFITASDDQLTETKALDVGCVAYLHKPFPAHLLVDAIKKAKLSAPRPS